MRTLSEHKIDTFSLVEDGRKDACVGADSLNYVDFVVCVEGRVLGMGESDYVLPSHLMQVRGLKRYGRRQDLLEILSHLMQVRGLKRIVEKKKAPRFLNM